MNDPAPNYHGRFAPSPTGPLHMGSLLAAFGSWLLARHAGGRWSIRIEDIDPPRAIPGAGEQQLRALQAFGLESDTPIVWQSQRGDLYQTALQTLFDNGDAFQCHCSRADLVEQGGIHRFCVPAGHAQSSARLRVPDGVTVSFEDLLQGPVKQSLGREVGDFVLRRADGFWAYQLAVVVDDAAQHITDVVRGADLLDSTARQIFLQQRLGLPTPRYTHLPLLLDAQGRKLSKSDAASPVDANHPLPALRTAWRLLGQTPQALDEATTVSVLLQRACAHFNPRRIPQRRALDFAAPHNNDSASPP